MLLKLQAKIIFKITWEIYNKRRQAQIKFIFAGGTPHSNCRVAAAIHGFLNSYFIFYCAICLAVLSDVQAHSVVSPRSGLQRCPCCLCLPWCVCQQNSSLPAGSQMALKFSLLVSCIPSPSLQLDALGCYVRENSAKLAFSEVQNNVTERIAAFKGKSWTTGAARHDRTWFQFSSLSNVNFHFPRSKKMLPLYKVITLMFHLLKTPCFPSSDVSLLQNWN